MLSSLTYGPVSYDGRFEVVRSLTHPRPVPASNVIPPGDELSSRFSWDTSVATHRVAEPNSAVITIAESVDGKIWLGTQDKGLFYMRGNKVSAVGSERLSRTITCLLPLESGELWIGTEKGVFKPNGANLTQTGVPSSLPHTKVFAMIRDRDTNIWLGTSDGLFRVNGKEVSRYEGGSGINAPITALFEDREGNLWVGRAGDIERLRDSTFVSYPVSEKGSVGGGPIYVGQGGQAWFAPFKGGLHRLRQVAGESVTNAGLSADVVYSLTGGRNDLWIGRQRGGLTHVLYDNGSFATKTYTEADGLAQNSVFAVHESRDGTIWSGTLSGGVSELRNGHFTTYTAARGLASDTVSSIADGTDGTMWFGTPNGLSAMTASGWKTYTLRDGLPSSDVNCLLFDSSGVLWIGTAAGLGFLTGNHLKVPRGVPHSLEEPIFGMAEDGNGWLWITTAGHVLRVRRSSLTRDALSEADIREYGLEDELLGTEGIRRYRSVVTDSQGNIWLSTNRGISVANAIRATVDSAPALVHIDAVLVDGTTVDTEGVIRLSAKTQRATFRYVGLSLANSERVRYRYRLEGFDSEWSEPTTNREVTYGNLGAGKYRFRVIASNSGGLWSELWSGSEAAVRFEVEPSLWQTRWFRISFVAITLLSVLCAHRLRLYQLTQQFNMRLEERANERTRIARDLHDTMLQSFQGVMLKFYALSYILDRPAEARQTLEGLVVEVRQAITEGREAVQGLRSSTFISNDLARALTTLGQKLAAEQDAQNRAAFQVEVERETRELHPILRDEVYRIASESVRNAFRHSGAVRIEVEIRYDDRQFRVRIRDNGKSIDPKVLEDDGRIGHYGLPGMRERAKLVGGKLAVWSELNSGTETELTIPASLAYSKSRSPRCSIFSRKGA